MVSASMMKSINAQSMITFFLNIQSAALKLSNYSYSDNFTINAKGNYWGVIILNTLKMTICMILKEADTFMMIN